MKRNEAYLITKKYNTYFLLPTGQACSDCLPPIQTNELGAFLWACLEQEQTIDSLQNLVEDNFSVSDKDRALLVSDISDFISNLKTSGALLEEPLQSSVCSNFSFIQIAGITIKLNCSKELISKELSDFEITDESFENVDISLTPYCSVPLTTHNGNVLIRNKNNLVIEADDCYILSCKEYIAITELHITKDFSCVSVYHKDAPSEILSKELYLALRIPFLLNAVKNNMIMLHSSSVLYNDKVYCFSAPSKTGKSTYANLWVTHLNTLMVNGDTNLLSYKDNQVCVEGTPWCGTSGCYTKKSFPLGGIIFLSQGKTIIANRLSAPDFFVKLSARLLSPLWFTNENEKIISIAEKVVDSVPAWSLSFTLTKESVSTLKEIIDKSI